MTFDLTEKRKVKINMDDYIERVINKFPMKIRKSDTDLTPDGNIFSKKGNRRILGKKETEEFHT